MRCPYCLQEIDDGQHFRCSKEDKMPPHTGDRKPDDFVPDDHMSPELRKQLEEMDKEEKKDAEVRERSESDKD